MSKLFSQKIKFSKYEGAGNDFILIDDRSLFFPTEERNFIRQLCHRRFGIGADGLILLQPNVYMRIFNSDGDEAEGCGNGVRCLVRFLADLGFQDSSFCISVGDRILKAHDLGESVAVEMGEMREMCLSQKIEGMEIHFIDSGVPHAVWFVPNVKEAPLEKIGPLLRHHPLFAPRGANVNIASIEGDRVRIRTYERGVEGETLACGTGAIAVACLGARLFNWKSPVQIACTGGDLTIYFDEQFQNVLMAGPAKRIFTGKAIIEYALCTTRLKTQCSGESVHLRQNAH